LASPFRRAATYYSYTQLPGTTIGLLDFRLLLDRDAFNRFLRETFTQIKQDNVQHLIIDLRQNGGGDSGLGNALLGYLTDKPFTQFARSEWKISAQTRSNSGAVDKPDGSIIASVNEAHAPPDNPLRFRGDVYVLIGPTTFSSATALASTFKDYQLGVLVGEETGGLATAYGDVYSFKLTRSGLYAGVSFQHFTRPSGQDDGRGVLPDHAVRPTAADIAAGKDTVLTYTRALIQRTSSSPQP
nr:S41 family peptidase [Chloroflexaceae bacterium]